MTGGGASGSQRRRFVDRLQGRRRNLAQLLCGARGPVTSDSSSPGRRVRQLCNHGRHFAGFDSAHEQVLLDRSNTALATPGDV